MPGMKNMGVLNQGWGICGFTSSLYALYANRPDGKLAQAALVGSRMLAEIKTFLVMLQANGDQTTINDIEAFTRIFPGFSAFTVSGYIQKINAIANLSAVNTSDATYSIALPPNAVVQYLKIMCGFSAAREIPLNQTRQELIIGVRESGGRTSPYGGLCHWMYQRPGAIHSWGQVFSTVSGADAKFIVCSHISPNG